MQGETERMDIPTTGYNLVISLLIPFVALFLPLILDDNAVKILSVTLGAFIGGIGVDYIRPEKTIWRNIRKILCSSLFAIPPSFAFARYYQLEQWEYSLLVGFINGLIAVILITVILAIADEKLKSVITTLLWKEVKTTEVYEVTETKKEKQ